MLIIELLYGIARLTMRMEVFWCELPSSRLRGMGFAVLLSYALRVGSKADMSGYDMDCGRLKSLGR